MAKTVLERFEEKVMKDPNSGCWLWTGTLQSGGYGLMWGGGREGNYILAHRAAYEAYIGPIPDGLHIDHICRTRSCVNPHHLEPVTCRENIRRGTARDASVKRGLLRTHCKRGHEFTEKNTLIVQDRGGFYKACRTCNRENMRKFRARARAKC